MDSERPNERALWSSRLEEPDALPGVGLTDKEATWDKLYERLRETPRRRALPWLWTAAACLLLALIPAAFLLREKRVVPRSGPQKVAVRPGTLVPRTDRQPTGQPGIQTSIPDPIPPAVIRNSPPVESLAFVTPPHPTRRERSAHIKNPARDLAPIVSNTQDQPGLSATRSPEQLLSTMPGQPQAPVTVTILPAPKKQPRVVHINELESQPSAPGLATGPRQKPGRLQVGFNSEHEIFRPATTYQTYYPIISFRPSQNP